MTSDAPRLWGLAAAEIWRRIRQRLRAGPLYRWRFSGLTPERVLIAPPDLRIADPQIAEEIYSGRFPLAGQLVEADGESPFLLTRVNPEWAEALHSFRWLRHLREAGTDLASANARALVNDWIATSGRRIGGIAWEPGVTAKRIISWLQHSSIVLQGSELPFYRAYMRSLSAQIRYLRTMCPEMREDEDRLRARIAIAFAALSLPVSTSSLRSASNNLGRELDRQILPDGGHISRNPEAVLELLADLLPLRHTYANQATEPPRALMGAIDRMVPALRFFRHEDGNLARFNGVGATIPDRIVTVLRHDETAGQPVLHAPHSGYSRMSMGFTTVIADTGPPPPFAVSQKAHAGCLSFEMSSGRHCYIINSGVDLNGPPELRLLARSTAAHSTATINDTSSCRFSVRGWLQRQIGSPIVGGPHKVRCERIDGNGMQGFVASHDGYAGRFGLVHERRLSLEEQGSIISGSDRFYRPGELPPLENRSDRIAVRFHLHPEVNIILDGDGHLMLMTDRGDSWVFTCEEVEPQVEDSIYFAGLLGPWKTRQIVLNFEAQELSSVRWRLTRTGLGIWSQQGA
jgi:uncharacterized heparinase superfamily protein